MPSFGAVGRFPIGVVTSGGGQTEIITVDKWFDWLSEPVRLPLRLRTGAEPFLAFEPAPSPFVASGWYNWLTEPVRVKVALAAALQQALIETAPQPVTLFTASIAMPLFEWRLQYQALSTVLPRLLPKPNITGTMNLLEQHDIFFSGGMIFLPPNSGEIGISEQTVASIGEVGLAESPAPGAVSIFGGSIGISQV